MTQQIKIIAVVTTAAIVMLGVGLTFGSPTIVEGKEINPAHDADNGLGNEKNFGQCQQDPVMTGACVAKFK
jgi:hypothetical protein